MSITTNNYKNYILTFTQNEKSAEGGCQVCWGDLKKFICIYYNL